MTDLSVPSKEENKLTKNQKENWNNMTFLRYQTSILPWDYFGKSINIFCFPPPPNVMCWNTLLFWHLHCDIYFKPSAEFWISQQWTLAFVEGRLIISQTILWSQPLAFVSWQLRKEKRSRWLCEEEDLHLDKSSETWGPKLSCPAHVQRKPWYSWRTGTSFTQVVLQRLRQNKSSSGWVG